MDIWGILGLEPTDDTTKIKRAYSQKLKVFHPEEDPKGFQKLKEAYDSALKLAKQLKNNGDNFSVSYDYMGGLNSNEEYDFQEETLEKDEDDQNSDYEQGNSFNERDSEEVKNFMKKVEELYNDFPRRMMVDNWTSLLNSILWNVSGLGYLNVEMLAFLTDHSNLPKDVLTLLNQHFSLDKPHVYEHFDHKDLKIDYVLRLLKLKEDLSFHYLKEGYGFDVEEYLTHRQRAFLLVKQDLKKKALEHINKAKKIYGEDPELLILEGECLSYVLEYDDALASFNKALTLAPNHQIALLARGRLHYEKGNYRECLKDYLQVKDYENKIMDYPLQFARCYNGMKDYSNARIWYKKALEREPSDLTMQQHIAQLDEKLCKKYRRKSLFGGLKAFEKEEYKIVKAELKQFHKQGVTDRTVKRKLFIGVTLGVTIILTLWILTAVASIGFHRDNNNTTGPSSPYFNSSSKP